jgi:hypothetical protein
VEASGRPAVKLFRQAQDVTTQHTGDSAVSVRALVNYRQNDPGASVFVTAEPAGIFKRGKTAVLATNVDDEGLGLHGSPHGQHDAGKHAVAGQSIEAESGAHLCSPCLTIKRLSQCHHWSSTIPRPAGIFEGTAKVSESFDNSLSRWARL